LLPVQHEAPLEEPGGGVVWTSFPLQEPLQKGAVPSQRQLRPGVEQQSALVPVMQFDPNGGF
jgi:hypothetical protein